MEPIKKDEIFVIELSSYQLDDIEFSPDIAVVTNLFPEHMNYHGNEKKYYEELNQILENSRSSFPSKIIETERRKKNGEIISVKISVAKLPSKNGEYAGRSIIIKDHSEYKKLQAQIDQSEKLAVIGQIAAGVAHEIGNPLASISSLVQILQRKNKDSYIEDQLAANNKKITESNLEEMDKYWNESKTVLGK